MTNSLETTNWYDERATEIFNEVGFVQASAPCACMGPRDGEPYCFCRMMRMAEERVFARANIAQQLGGILKIKQTAE